MITSFEVGRSKTGLPTVTECGGGMSNTGFATLVCGENGQPLKPLFIPRGYSNQDHAVFVVRPGQTCLVTASHGKWGEEVKIEKILKIDDKDNLQTETIAEYDNGDGNIPPQFKAVTTAALKKTRCYHCREAHYHA